MNFPKTREMLSKKTLKTLKTGETLKALKIL
jgi:hypothetical protein